MAAKQQDITKGEKMSQNSNSSVRQNSHPLYGEMLDAWELGRRCYRGEPAIKEQKTEYLPATAGMVADGYGSADITKPGNLEYAAYLTRAYYPDIYMEAVETAIGVMHRKPATIEVTPRLEVLLERATDQGEDLQLLLRRINAQQLMTGRVGLLGDIRVVDGVPEPILIVYKETQVFNWDDSLDAEQTQNLRLVQIDESGNVLSETFSWKWENRSRVLALTNKEGLIVKFDDAGKLEESGKYSTAILRDNQSIMAAQYEQPNAQGNVLESIPFSFINAKDLSTTPDKPPLDGLARLTLAIYRGEADYRQNLFMQGQDTLVRIGASYDEDEIVRTGAGARIDVPVSGDAKYIGVSGSGLSEQRESLKSDYEKAEKKASKLMGAGGAQESGEALKIRVAAQTATLPQIAQAGAAGLLKVLRDLAEWLGDNPDDIVVKPNLEFTDSSGNGQTLQQIVTSKVQGAPISDESIHAWMVKEGFTTKTYNEELVAIVNEEPKV